MTLAPRNPADTRLGPKRAAGMLIFFASWIAVVGGYYLWHGFHRSTADLGTRLQDASNPKNVQDATIELAARMKQRDAEAQRWYPTLLKMTGSSSPEQRGVAAWIMANDTSRDDFHQALLRLTKDASPSVRANAAVSLDKFKDPAGRQTILAMLSPAASSDDTWEGLRALRVIGTPADLALVARFEASSEPRIREAARAAADGIRDR